MSSAWFATRCRDMWRGSLRLMLTLEHLVLPVNVFPKRVMLRLMLLHQLLR